MLFRLHSQNLYSKDSHATVVTKYFATITTWFLQCTLRVDGNAAIRSLLVAWSSNCCTAASSTESMVEDALAEVLNGLTGQLTL